ncbi:hypothetical protein [Bradyrhizobium sp. USDA 336]|uniref:hypothetical protein n=1 Tax=Bradyrhizobium sp. USDA 336 TaxID=3156311 RepID=UPI00384ED29E
MPWPRACYDEFKRFGETMRYVFSTTYGMSIFAARSDAITGNLLCLLHGKYDYFNMGVDKPEISVQNPAEIYQQASLELFRPRGAERSSDAEYLVDNPNRRCPVIKKARDILGYASNIHVNEGMRRCLSFLRDELGA